MGTVYVDKLDPQSGTALEIGSSGDTITIPSGATITNSGTASGFAPVGISSSMTSGSGLAIDSAGHITMPLQSAFNARSNSNQTVSTSNDTPVKSIMCVLFSSHALRCVQHLRLVFDTETRDRWSAWRLSGIISDGTLSSILGTVLTSVLSFIRVNRYYLLAP